ncbi:hypothetical protein L249_7419 [Ophiocordyceps polyrhachis-furcata BCC 54312]|uniref:Uncharacterized protein n=1 Tax=Ophiocordyceps polyrhachis-furcata BCC 54312 TaxID=1330021 RepID=A0A367LAY7_9HYPO|nr:hypothetical protein L249_7419 [Ophiocordyceps polyrhachis-furcata BCC 54312]
MWGKSRAVEEEEGGEKLVEIEIIISNQGVDHVIEKKKTNYVIVVFNEVKANNKLEVGTSKGGLEEDFNVMDQPDDLTLVRPSRSGAITAISTARRSLAPIDVQRADRCDDRCNESIGRYDRYSPTVTQGVVAGLRPNWYNLFQVALQAYFLSV